MKKINQLTSQDKAVILVMTLLGGIGGALLCNLLGAAGQLNEDFQVQLAVAGFIAGAPCFGTVTYLLVNLLDWFERPKSKPKKA